MECREQQKKIIKLTHEEWTRLVGEALRVALKSKGLILNGGELSIKLVGNHVHPDLYITSTTAKNLLNEKGQKEGPVPEDTLEIEGTLEIESELDPEADPDLS